MHYQLFVTFGPQMPWGPILSIRYWKPWPKQFSLLMKETDLRKMQLEIIMSILSNYTPECLVNCHVEGDVQIFDKLSRDMSGVNLQINSNWQLTLPCHDPYRAVTHNKGIFNGMDAVIMATGNDFRAVEACGHAYASRNGSTAASPTWKCSENTFPVLPLRSLWRWDRGRSDRHPSHGRNLPLEILGHPSSEELMQIIAAAGLANNFSAVRSLITTGIQQGHMKMHLGNILRQLNATPEEAPW